MENIMEKITDTRMENVHQPLPLPPAQENPQEEKCEIVPAYREDILPVSFTPEAARRSALRAHFEHLRRQAEALRAVYPDFSLEAEMNNPLFMRLTSPRVGLDVRTAYEVAHHEEMQKSLMRRGAQALAESLRSGMRPMENGMVVVPAATLPSDPRSWSPKEREEIRRRVRRGEKIRF